MHKAKVGLVGSSKLSRDCEEEQFIPRVVSVPIFRVNMERILRGIMRYRHTTRDQMVQEFKKVRDNPEVCC